MKTGVLIYAHNNRSVDYALMAIISGGLAKKHLNVPVSLATDKFTVQWMQESGTYDTAKNLFDQIILVEKPETNNNRRLYDGENNEVVPFVNLNRCSAWNVTPYDRTLLIDSDFLIFSNRLSEYWDVDCDLMIGDSINDVHDKGRLGYHDRYVSDVGIKLYWATTVMFTKNQTTKTFFDLVEHIRVNYQYYSDLYRFDSRQYRNDISFSVAKHILDGFETPLVGNLPPVLTSLDRDILYEIKDDSLLFLISPKLDSNYCAASFKNLDIHVMNKQSIIRNKENLMRLI